jgi:hypothetical protein
MKQAGFLLVIFSLALASCAKDRKCECKNSNSTYTAGTVKATKRNAKKYCEGLSTSSTTCYLK